jgi:LysM repeat protein
MSEMPPEGGGGGTGSFLQKKFLGIPAIVWLIGAAVLAYLYFRSQNSSSSTSTGSSTPANVPQNANSGTSTTGDTTFGPPTTNLTINSQYSQASNSTTGSPPPRHATANPQPTPAVKPATKKAVTTVKTPAKATSVTVAKWTASNTPWNSTLWGIANHYDTTVANLLKLNPQIKNANLVYPGEKVKV